MLMFSDGGGETVAENDEARREATGKDSKRWPNCFGGSE